MKRIFIGLFFLLFDLNFYMGTSVIGLLPAFVGYILILLGMGKVEDSRGYQSVRSKIKIPAIFMGVMWVMGCTGLSVMVPSGVAYVLVLVSAAFQLLVTWWIVKGIREMEDTFHYDLYGRSLRTAWQVILAWVVLDKLAAFVGVDLLELLAGLMRAVFSVYYIFRFYKSWKEYKELVL